MPRIQVNSDALFSTSDRMGELAQQTTRLAGQLLHLNNQADLFIANWMSSSGRDACGLILDSRHLNDDFTQKITRLSEDLAKAAVNYGGAEEKAQQLLEKYHSGDLKTGWQSNMGLSLAGIVPAELAYLLGDWGQHMLDEANQSDNLVHKSLSYVAARSLFGAEKYLDAEATKGNGILEEKFRQDTLRDLGLWGMMSLGFDKAFKLALPWLNKKAKEYGYNRPLDHSERVQSAEVDESLQELVIPYTYQDHLHNARVAEDVDGRIDSLMAGQGRVEKYQGVTILYVKNGDGTETAFVYVTGTNFESHPATGDSGDALQNVAELNVNPTDALSDGSASMQLVEDALTQAGIPEGTALVLVGFSKGASTAVNFAQNQQMKDKYKIQSVIDIAGPTGKRPEFDDDISYHKIADTRDGVVGIGGSYGQKDMDVVTLHNEEDAMTHGISMYERSGEESLAAQLDVPETAAQLDGAEIIGRSASAGSTQPAGKTPGEMKAYELSTYGGMAYDAIDTFEEILPHTIESQGVKFKTKVPDLPDLPALITPENQASDYFEAAYNLTHEQNWDSTKPSFDLSPQHFAENEKSFEYTVGSPDQPHIEVKIDDGNYQLDMVNANGEAVNPFKDGIKTAWEMWEKQNPELPTDNHQGWDEVPRPPKYETMPVSPQSAPGDFSSKADIQFIPAQGDLFSVGGNF